MKDTIIYIAEVSLFLSIFFLIYKLFFNSATFFQFNRVYLLAGIIASFVLPLIEFSYDVPVFYSTLKGSVSNNTITGYIADSKTDSVWIILFLLYLSGVLVLTAYSILQYVKIYKLIKAGRLTKNNKYIIVDNENIRSPFSTYKYILLNTKNLSTTEQELILKHEITHVIQKHWFDLFCSQCALVMQWFNPLTWLYISSLKENHEFLADKAVLDTGYPAILYQATLINQRFHGPVFSFANSFNYSNHLKRLTMMKKMKSSPWKRLAVLVLIPALGLFFWVSATPNYVLQNTEIQAGMSPTIPETYDADSQPIAGTPDDDDKPKAEKNEKTEKKIIRIYVNGKPSAGNSIKDGEYYITCPDSSGIKTSFIAMGNSVVKDSIIIARSNFVAVEIPDTTRAKKHTITFENKVEKAKVIAAGTSSKKEPLMMIIDGKEVPDINNIDLDTIESITVLKDKASTELYGEKGKNGVIIVVLKK